LPTASISAKGEVAMSGIFGIASRSNCMEDLFYGTDYHSHLGTEFAGLAIQGNRIHREIHRMAHGQFKSLFDGFYHNYSGQLGVGVISDSEPQPIIAQTRFGTFAIVTTGLIANRSQLERELIEQGVSFTAIEDGQLNQTELVAKIIALSSGIVEGIEDLFRRIEGSVSLLLMTADGIYAACDGHARLPLVIGTRQGAMAATNETCAFPNLELQACKYLQPGEIVFFNASGMEEATQPRGKKRICSFLWIYTGYPASSYEGVSVETVRERCGQALARKDSVQVDLVAGVPDSGTGHAIGYAMQSGRPFRRPLVKYSAGYGRSYTPPSQELRDQIAKMKLIPIEDITRGNRLIVCEDSIVRGTQLRNLTIQKLWQAGAAEVHLRVACPPLMFPCIYSLSTRTAGELAARRAIRALEGGDATDVIPYLDPNAEQYTRMVEWIRKDLGCTSLIYLTIDEMVEAIGLPPSDLCTYCWRGESG
jgi:amidophosphoribosyltransferase